MIPYNSVVSIYMPHERLNNDQFLSPSQCKCEETSPRLLKRYNGIFKPSTATMIEDLAKLRTLAGRMQHGLASGGRVSVDERFNKKLQAIMDTIDKRLSKDPKHFAASAFIRRVFNLPVNYARLNNIISYLSNESRVDEGNCTLILRYLFTLDISALDTKMVIDLKRLIAVLMSKLPQETEAVGLLNTRLQEALDLPAMVTVIPTKLLDRYVFGQRIAKSKLKKDLSLLQTKAQEFNALKSCAASHSISPYMQSRLSHIVRILALELGSESKMQERLVEVKDAFGLDVDLDTSITVVSIESPQRNEEEFEESSVDQISVLSLYDKPCKPSKETMKSHLQGFFELARKINNSEKDHAKVKIDPRFRRKLLSIILLMEKKLDSIEKFALIRKAFNFGNNHHQIRKVTSSYRGNGNKFRYFDHIRNAEFFLYLDFSDLSKKEIKMICEALNTMPKRNPKVNFAKNLYENTLKTEEKIRLERKHFDAYTLSLAASDQKMKKDLRRLEKIATSITKNTVSYRQSIETISEALNRMERHLGHDLKLLARIVSLKHRFLIPLNNERLSSLFTKYSGPTGTCPSLKIVEHDLRTLKELLPIASVSERQNILSILDHIRKHPIVRSDARIVGMIFFVSFDYAQSLAPETYKDGYENICRLSDTIRNPEEREEKLYPLIAKFILEHKDCSVEESKALHLSRMLDRSKLATNLETKLLFNSLTLPSSISLKDKIDLVRVATKMLSSNEAAVALTRVLISYGQNPLSQYEVLAMKQALNGSKKGGIALPKLSQALWKYIENPKFATGKMKPAAVNPILKCVEIKEEDNHEADYADSRSRSSSNSDSSWSDTSSSAYDAGDATSSDEEEEASPPSSPSLQPIPRLNSVTQKLAYLLTTVYHSYTEDNNVDKTLFLLDKFITDHNKLRNLVVDDIKKFLKQMIKDNQRKPFFTPQHRAEISKIAEKLGTSFDELGSPQRSRTIAATHHTTSAEAMLDEIDSGGAGGGPDFVDGTAGGGDTFDSGSDTDEDDLNGMEAFDLLEPLASTKSSGTPEQVKVKDDPYLLDDADVARHKRVINTETVKGTPVRKLLEAMQACAEHFRNKNKPTITMNYLQSFILSLTGKGYSCPKRIYAALHNTLYDEGSKDVQSLALALNPYPESRKFPGYSNTERVTRQLAQLLEV